MFDSVELRYSVRDDEDPSANAALIARAQGFMLSFGGRMLCALRRLAGDHGAALGDALRTMIMSREIAPSQWPLREVEILARAHPAQDRQVERVLRALEELISASISWRSEDTKCPGRGSAWRPGALTCHDGGRCEDFAMNYIDCTEPYLTAAEAIGAARDAAIALRYQLPLLLGNRLAPTHGMLADRFERRLVLEPFPRSALATVLAECDLAIERGTSRHWILHETGWGPEGPIYTPESTLVRIPETEELLRIRSLL